MTVVRLPVFLVLIGLTVVIPGCTRFLESEGLKTRSGTSVFSDRSGPQIGSTRTTVLPPTDGETVADRDSRSGREKYQIFRGDGTVIQEEAAGRGTVRAAPSGDIVINFVDADIHEVMKAVFGRTLNLNYAIDPDVKGRITIQTSRPLAREAVIPTFESVLQMIGATLVATNGLYRIIPLSKAARSGAHVSGEQSAVPHPAGYGIRIVPLKYVGAKEMQKILGPIIPENGVLQIDPARNLLILAGTQRELGYMIETVQMFDVDWMKGMSFGLFPLENVGVSLIIKDLEAVFGNPETGTLAGLVRLVPIERLNTVLAVSPQAAYLDEVRKWVERLDRTDDGPGRRLFVYFVQNGKAGDLAAVLTAAVGSRRTARQATTATLAPGLRPVELRTPPPAPAAAGSRQSSARGTSGAGRSERSPVATRGQSAVQPQVHAGPRDSTDSVSDGEFRIVADESRNALLITATRSEFRIVSEALKKLDLLPLQVLLEATIAEVTLRDQLQYGLQWFFQSGQNKFTFSSASSGAVAATFPGFSYFFTSKNASAALSALTDLTDVNVISSPQLLVLNNATATLTVGDQVPIATQSSVSSVNPDAPIVNSIQYRDTGVTLRVTPRVNFGGLVTLEIEEETSEVVQTTTSGIDSPTIQQRKISSSVALHNGETVALGGMIKDTRSNTKTGLPLLSSIPVLGSLFRSTSDDARRTELLILITPRVIRSRNDAKVVTEELRQRLRGLRSLDGKIR